MNEKLKAAIMAAVEEYLEVTEAWDDAMLAVNAATGEARLIELEEAADLPDDIDEYDIMEFIQMTPEGKWIADTEAIDEVATQ